MRIDRERHGGDIGDVHPPSGVISAHDREERIPAETEKEELEAVGTRLACGGELNEIQGEEKRSEDAYGPSRDPPPDPEDDEHAQYGEEDRGRADDELIRHDAEEAGEPQPATKQYVVERHVRLVARQEFPEQRPRPRHKVDREQ